VKTTEAAASVASNVATATICLFLCLFVSFFVQSFSQPSLILSSISRLQRRFKITRVQSRTIAELWDKIGKFSPATF